MHPFLSDCMQGQYLDIQMNFVQQSFLSSGYQANLRLFLALNSSSILDSMASRTLVALSTSIYPTIDYTWFYFSNASLSLQASRSPRMIPGWLRLVVAGSSVSAYYRAPGQAWTQLSDYRYTSQSLAMTAPVFRIGVDLAPNYNTALQAMVSVLLVGVDTDGDGLFDDEEVCNRVVCTCVCARV